MAFEYILLWYELNLNWKMPAGRWPSLCCLHDPAPLVPPASCHPDRWFFLVSRVIIMMIILRMVVGGSFGDWGMVWQCLILLINVYTIFFWLNLRSGFWLSTEIYPVCNSIRKVMNNTVWDLISNVKWGYFVHYIKLNFEEKTKGLH